MRAPGGQCVEQLARHDRAGIKADRTARDQIAAAHGDEVGGARSGADEMHGHGAAPEVASAQVAAPTTSRGPSRRAGGPAAASAAASATDGTPMQRQDALGAGRGAGASGFEIGLRTPARRATPSFAAVGFDAGFAVLRRDGGDRSRAHWRRDRHAPARRGCAASMSGAGAPRLQPTPATIMAWSRPIA